MLERKFMLACIGASKADDECFDFISEKTFGTSTLDWVWNQTECWWEMWQKVENRSKTPPVW